MSRSRLALALALLGCGPAASSSGAPSPTAGDETAADCATLRAEERAAQGALDACRASTPSAEWALRGEFDWLEQAIGARLDAARRGGSVESSVQQMQEIAEHVWAMLDEVPEDQRDPAILGRIEDGAEALMRTHDAEGRQDALAQLAGALGQLRERLEPAPPSDVCEAAARDAAAAWMSAQAACGE